VRLATARSGSALRLGCSSLLRPCLWVQLLRLLRPMRWRLLLALAQRLLAVRLAAAYSSSALQRGCSALLRPCVRMDLQQQWRQRWQQHQHQQQQRPLGHWSPLLALAQRLLAVRLAAARSCCLPMCA
jgi:hypothetical protein